MNTRILVAIIFIALSAMQISAHDFWLAATRDGGTVTITGHIGETFPVADGKTTPDRVDTWEVIGPNGDLKVGRDFFQQNESLATRIAPESPGTYLGIMTILPRTTEMKGKAFTDYLREEGLDHVIAERARLHHSDQSARERYTRFAKIVLHTGERETAHITRAAGIKAEFVPSVNPATVAPGSPLSVQLLVEGRPVAGALVALVTRGTGLDGRTDAEGRVTFIIPSRGAWLIKTVHMAKPVDAGTPPADWESYWITLAFEN
jgi:hypothetical protein